MSFNYGVADVVALGRLAWKVYISCKHAPESFGNISSEVLSLHAVLREFEDNLTRHASSNSQQEGLRVIGEGCQNVLDDLQQLVNKYESLGTNTKRTWDRLRWNSGQIAELRSRLISNTVLLTAYISTSQIAVQTKLEKFLLEFQDGKREGSVLSHETADSLCVDEKDMWRAIQTELEDIGVSVAAFNANKDFIFEWFKNGVSSGAFEERASSNRSSLENSRVTFETLNIEDGEQGQTRMNSLSPVRRSLSQDSRPLNEGRAHSPSQQNPTNQHIVHERPVSTSESRDSGSTLVLNHKMDDEDTKINGDDTSRLASNKARTKNKRMTRVKSLFAKLFDLDEQLHQWAAYGGADTVLKSIIKYGANVNSKNSRGETALIEASFLGHIQVVCLLLDEGADINLTDNEQKSALIVAADQGHWPVVRRLLDKGADINASTNTGISALYKSIDNIHERATEELLHTSDKIETDYDAMVYALSLAICQGNLRVIKRLLDAKVNVNSRMDFRISISHIELLEDLKSKKDELGSLCFHSETALNLAVHTGDERIVSILLMAGADVNAMDNDTLTALKIASLRGHEGIVALLLEAGADVHATDCQVEIGSRSEPLEAFGPAMNLPLLQNAGKMTIFGVETNCYRSMTAFEIAVINDHEDAMRILLKAGANGGIDIWNGRESIEKLQQAKRLVEYLRSSATP